MGKDNNFALDIKVIKQVKKNVVIMCSVLVS